MVKREELTIVMPVYCPGKYLRPCIESLLVQTFQDFRLIAIDDASPDGSYDILQKFAEQDSRVLVLRNPYRLGAARTRNIGMQIAQGKYLLVLDADDYFEPNFLSVLHRKIEETKADIVICAFYWRDECTNQEWPFILPETIIKYVKNPFSPTQIWKYFFQIIPEPPFCKIMRLKFIQDNQLEFQDIKYSNDVSFAHLSALKARLIAYVDTPLMHYRYNTSKGAASISASRGKKPLCIYRALKKIHDSLIMIHQYDAYRQSFHDKVISAVMYNMRVSSASKRRKYIHFFKEKGFKSLSMNELQENDFLTTYSYCVWKQFMLNDIVKFEVDDLVYQHFFKKLADEKSVFALWGYGKLGMHFLEKCKKYQFPIQEVYDQDSSKWTESQIPPVKDFSLRNPRVDTIIYTNTKYSMEIKRRVQLDGENLRLIDFSVFIQFNLIGMS